MVDSDILFFFDGKLNALPLYEAFAGQVLSRIPDVKVKVQKTQITFSNRHGFAFVSFLPVRRAQSRPPVYITVSFGLGRRVDSPRVDAVSQPYPGRWTHHVLVSSPEELDDELMAWVQEGAEFAAMKGRGPGKNSHVQEVSAMTYQEEFIHFMVRSGVLTFGDFTTKSGRKTPYFVNTGSYKTGAQASRLGDYYAACIQEHLPGGIDALFGPAYKGIPLAVCAAAALYRSYGRDLPYCFNRKEVKDHGEGGSMVGYQPKDGDRIAIIEDVVTAGTAVRETIELFRHVADVKIQALFVSVDRMERGTRSCSTLEELREDYGIQVFPIVTIRDVISCLHNRPVDGRIYIDDAMRARMEDYLATYGGRSEQR